MEKGKTRVANAKKPPGRRPEVSAVEKEKSMPEISSPERALAAPLAAPVVQSVPTPAPVVMDPSEGLDFEGDTRKYMSEADSMRIQMNHLKLRLIAKDKEVSDLKLRLDDKEMTLLQIRVREEMEKLKSSMMAGRKNIEQSEQEERAQKEINRADIETIGKKHGIVGKPFGYNPDTLEIVTE